MEPVRPLVDRYAFEFLARRSFALDDFYETRQGVCRVTPPLVRELALTAPDWGRAVGPVAEDVARHPLGSRNEPCHSSDRRAVRRYTGRPQVTERTVWLCVLDRTCPCSPDVKG